MRVVMGCVVVWLLWQQPSAETKKPAEDKSAGQAQSTGETAKSGGTASAASLASGKKTYKLDCAMCHGNEGAGDGDLAADMKLKLKDLRDEATLKDMSDQELTELITKGKGQMMGEEGRLRPEQVKDVVNYVRSLAKK